MFIYVLYWLSAILLGCSVFFCKKKNTLMLLITIIVISIISGIRFKTGTDWDPYYNLFYYGANLASYLSYNHFEMGFCFLNWLIFYIFGNYNVFLFILAFSVLSLKFLPIWKRPYVFLCFIPLLGIFLGDLFSTRQQLAIAIIFVAVYYLSMGKMLRFIIIATLAALIHKTALIVIPFGILLNKLNRVGSCFLLGVLAGIAAIIMVECASSNAGLISNIAQQYLEITPRISYLSIGYNLLGVMFVLIIYPKIKSDLLSFERLAVKFYLFGVPVFILINTKINMFIGRIAYFFTSFEFVVVASFIYFFIKKFKKDEKIIVFVPVFMLFIIYYLLRFWANINFYHDLYIPYQTIFSDFYRNTY